MTGESFGRIFSGSGQIGFDLATAQLKAGKTAAETMLPYGNGRSYGDSCLNSVGQVIAMRNHAALIKLDVESGELVAEAGMLLSEVINTVIVQGFFPPVVPGTRFVTLGGAVANDIHGKNHHVAGTFGNHVLWFDLLRSDGKTYRCSPTKNRKLFAATIGGMGLTGLILTVALRLKRVASPDVIETRHSFRNVEEYLGLAEGADAENEYAVAWINQLAAGSDTGQGILLCGNHLQEAAQARFAAGNARLGVPFDLPFTVLNRPFISLFNAAYGFAKRRPASAKASSWQSYFFPLDGVNDWNRLYGPRGLFQHQSVVPFEAAREALPRLLAETHKAGQASFLTVLKRFGTVKSPGLLSFPRPGYTLTLDFPNRGERTLRLLSELDAIVKDAGGAVNPYKDARMSPAMFEASFRHWRELEVLRDQAFMSDFWRRVTKPDPAFSAIAAE